MSAPATRSGRASFTEPPPRYQLPADLRLGPVRLQVADVKRSIGYYERVIGLRVLRSERSWAILGAHNDDVSLVELRERPGATPVPRRGRLGLYHYAILLPDRASLGRFLAHLSRLGEYAGMSDHLVSEAIYVTDPDGLGFDKVVLDYPGALFLSAGGYHHHLGTNTWATGASRATDADARLLEWTIELSSESDVSDAAQSLALSGYQIAHDGGDAVGTDPWGVGVRLTVR